MDPNAALKRCRKAAMRILADGRQLSPDEEETALAEAFVALDGWLRRGGFLPRDWQRPPDAVAKEA